MIGAFFDIDGTLIRESIMLKHFNKLIKYGIIDEEAYLKNIKSKYEAYEKRYGNYDDFIAEVGEVYRKKLVGLHKSIIIETANQVIKEGGELVYAYTRDRIKYHHSQGHKVFFVSGSPTYLVSILGELYNIEGFQGTEYEFDKEDRFTGKIFQMWDSESKLGEIQKLVEKHKIDVNKSYAYGDTNGDFSMLKTMKYATAINPSRKFLEMIKNDEDLKNRADIIVERKDIVYKLSPDVDLYALSE